MENSDVLALDLSEDEWYLLRSGLHAWGGPVNATDELARMMGFADESDLHRRGPGSLWDAIERRAPLSWSDWRRVVLATEIAFASVVIGAARDWRYHCGLDDGESIALLRAVQGKLLRAGRPA